MPAEQVSVSLPENSLRTMQHDKVTLCIPEGSSMLSDSGLIDQLRTLQSTTEETVKKTWKIMGRGSPTTPSTVDTNEINHTMENNQSNDKTLVSPHVSKSPPKSAGYQSGKTISTRLNAAMDGRNNQYKLDTIHGSNTSTQVDTAQRGASTHVNNNSSPSSASARLEMGSKESTPKQHRNGRHPRGKDNNTGAIYHSDVEDSRHGLQSPESKRDAGLNHQNTENSRKPMHLYTITTNDYGDNSPSAVSGSKRNIKLFSEGEATSYTKYASRQGAKSHNEDIVDGGQILTAQAQSKMNRPLNNGNGNTYNGDSGARLRSASNVYSVKGNQEMSLRSDVTLYTFTVRKTDTVFEKIGGKKASIHLQVDVDDRTLNFVTPHDAKESYSCAAVTARSANAKLGMTITIQTRNSVVIQKKISFFSNEDQTKFLKVLNYVKTMGINSSATQPFIGPREVGLNGGNGARDPYFRDKEYNQGKDGGGPNMNGKQNGYATSNGGLSQYSDMQELGYSRNSNGKENMANCGFPLLPGESVIETVVRVTNFVVMSQSDRAVQGIMRISNYRITFTPYDEMWKFGSFAVPLSAVEAIVKDGLILTLQCKDLRTIRLAMHDAYGHRKGHDQLPAVPDFRWINMLVLRMKPPNVISNLFAYDYFAEKNRLRQKKLKGNGSPKLADSKKTNGWLVYSPMSEYTRLGLFPNNSHGPTNSSAPINQHNTQDQLRQARYSTATTTSVATSSYREEPVITWRLLKNSKFRFSPTYPQRLVVPSLMTEEGLIKSASFRSLHRLPVVVWRHPVNNSILARSSQPNIGLAANKCESDRILLRAYRDAANKNSSGVSPPLRIIDARKPIASKGNQIRGKGVENSAHYDNAIVDFLGIANIHRMRDSLEALKLLVSGSGVEDGDKKYHSRLENTRWLKHIMRVLSGARRVAEVLHEDGASVLVHCSDGWDRTPQLVALAQLILDPYYRTIRGFAVLVEKEWCSFGHKFADRIGAGKELADAPNERSPVMLQFLDCVWQMTRQFPTCFEFNEKFLLHVVDSLVSGLYGTFLYNSERERIFEKVWERTESVWTPVLENTTPFRNPLYRATNSVLYPRANLKRIVLWDALFFRWDPESHPYHMEYEDPSMYDPIMDDQSTGAQSSNDGSSQDSPTLHPLTGQIDELRISEIDDEKDVDHLDINTSLYPSSDFLYGGHKPSLAASDYSDCSDDDEPRSKHNRSASATSSAEILQDSSDNRHLLSSSYSSTRTMSLIAQSSPPMVTTEQQEREIIERYHRGAKERTRQRTQGRNLREALEAAPDQSRIKYLEQLLSESIARELLLEAELRSVYTKQLPNGLADSLSISTNRIKRGDSGPESFSKSSINLSTPSRKHRNTPFDEHKEYND